MRSRSCQIQKISSLLMLLACTCLRAAIYNGTSDHDPAVDVSQMTFNATDFDPIVDPNVNNTHGFFGADVGKANQPLNTSAFFEEGGGHPDGKAAAIATTPAWDDNAQTVEGGGWVLDLKKNYKINGLTFVSSSGNGYWGMLPVEVYASEDGVAWNRIGVTEGVPYRGDKLEENKEWKQPVELEEAFTARFLKFIVRNLKYSGSLKLDGFDLYVTPKE